MEIKLKCSCGSVRGVIEDAPKSLGKRAICLCDDCQAYAHYLGRAKDILDANGGTDICPVKPKYLKITSGIENLRCLRLREKGMFRWYAGCCKSPIANLMFSAKIPFAGIPRPLMDFSDRSKSPDEVLGPVSARMLGKFGIPPLPPGTSLGAPLSLIVATIPFLLSGWVKGESSPSVFFDARTGKPKVEPYILTPAERENLRKFCGPQPSVRPA